jgi:N-acetylornithine carbamoyltransferase
MLQTITQLSQRNFLNTADFTQEEIAYLIDLALALKNGMEQKSLAGKSLATLFFNPSVRTRVSFATAMFKLGGQALDLNSESAWAFEYGDGWLDY